MERTAVWKWRELKRGEEEINEIIGRAGGQGSKVGPYTGERIDHANTHARAHTCTHSSYSTYSTHNQRPLHTLAHHSGVTRKTCACVWWLCMPAYCVYEAAWWWWWWCRGYGDKLHCPVTSIWGELGLVCRVLLEVICCCISDGLEMGLEREFMPPITERSERVTLNASHAQNN